MRRAGDTGGQRTHLDPGVLAEFRAGLITGRRGARIGAHLAACDRCAAFGDELAGVSALLATVPVPAIPDRVAQRLDTVLAAEAENRDHSERPDRDRPRTSAAHERPDRSHGFRWAALRVLAPAAVVVLLAAGGYELSNLGGSPVTQGASSPSAGHVNRTASGAGSSASPPLTPRAERMSPADFPAVIQLATFKQQVEAALRVPPAALRTEASSAALRGCVQAVTDGVKPVMVESVRYQDEPATLIVVRTSQGYTAWVAGSRCSATDRDLLAKTTVP